MARAFVGGLLVRDHDRDPTTKEQQEFDDMMREVLNELSG